MTLRDLLERAERATGPDRTLDALIEVRARNVEAARTGLAPEMRAKWRASRSGEVSDGHTFYFAAPVTDSVDAALALIGRALPGWIVSQCFEWEDDILRAKGPWLAILKERGVHLTAPNLARCQHAPTPALALCAALLAAMIEQETRDG